LSALLLVILLVALLIAGLGTVASYYAIWQGALKPFKKQWSEFDSATRRRVIVADVLLVIFMMAGLAFVIIAPFGKHTIAYLLGGVGLLLVIGTPMWAAVMAWRNAHRNR